jgi:hypothetical protein
MQVMQMAKGKSGKPSEPIKSGSTSDTDKLYEAWTEFSKKINDRMLRLANEGTYGYSEMFAIWNEYVQKMGEKLSKLTPDDKTTVREMQNVWTDYSDRMGKGFVELVNDGNGPFSELYELYSEYSERIGRRISEIMSERMREHKDLYELWMDTFGMSDSGYFENLSDSFGEMGKVWSDTWEKSKHLFVSPDGKSFDSTTLQEMSDQWTNAYSKALQDIMNSDAFANLNGSLLERNLEFKRLNHAFTNQYMASVGLPTREGMDEIYKKLHELDRKISEISRSLNGGKRSTRKPAKK